MLNTLHSSGTALGVVLLTAWGSYRHHSGLTNTIPPWRLVAADTLRRTLPVIILIATVTSLMSSGH